MCEQPRRDLADQEIWVHEINEQTAVQFREHVIEVYRRTPDFQPIIVYIDSQGGTADAMAMMIETLDCIDRPVFTVCLGRAFSAGAIILSHGDQRWCGKHSRVMVHEMLAGTEGNINDIKSDASEMTRLNRYWMNILAENCKIKDGYKGFKKLLRDYDGRDVYLNAQQAVKFGIVDHIGIPVIEVVTTTNVRTFK